MRISWMGHSCFLIETKSGFKVITDPYESGSYGGALRYKPVNVRPDIVTISHSHLDHCYIENFKCLCIINSAGINNIENIKVEGIDSYHDKVCGRQRGKNIIFVIEAEGLKIAHFGDLGTLDLDYSRLKGIDVAFVPVGGTFTIDAPEAVKLIENISPRISIPMHYKTPEIDFDISGVEEFLKGRDYQQERYLELSSENVNTFKKVVVLDYQK
ncbi:MAG: MBL fold metallo-hydrolase [Candidatus Omnitrophica bacterium]|nr:MBL fold metallo-hydrolase [Candidatus Omnitrophota bacterium]MDD5429478.1 MBL fold metallo-hydrolase [Candidatus Omnitrophota bacterium]